MTILALLAWAVPALGACQLALLFANLRRFQAAAPPATPREAAARDLPPISVLVPARNEGPTIARCLQAILDQPGIHLELLVLDDHSRDDTAARIVEVARQDPRCRAIASDPLPPGWTGKNHACSQLAYEAQGDWLLFVDADTVLAPGAIARAIDHAQAARADLLSFWPRQVMGSPGERLVLPLLALILLGFLPLALAERLEDPRLAAANGQCLLFTRAIYAACGGHEAIASEVVDDIALARAVKRAHGRVVLRDAGPLASCRMYHSFAEVWAGFRKNIYAAFGGEPAPFLAGIGLFALLHALPLPLALVGGLVGRPGLWLPMAVQVAVGITMRWVLAWRLKQPLWDAALHPLGAAVVVGLALDSWRGHLQGSVAWKGRSYRVGARE